MLPHVSAVTLYDDMFRDFSCALSAQRHSLFLVVLMWRLWYSLCCLFFFFSSRRRHTRCLSDWSSDVCSSDLSCHERVAVCVQGDGLVQGTAVAYLSIVAIGP